MASEITCAYKADDLFSTVTGQSHVRNSDVRKFWDNNNYVDTA